jgi:hypothetical protein
MLSAEKGVEQDEAMVSTSYEVLVQSNSDPEGLCALFSAFDFEALLSQIVFHSYTFSGSNTASMRLWERLDTR